MLAAFAAAFAASVSLVADDGDQRSRRRAARPGVWTSADTADSALRAPAETETPAPATKHDGRRTNLRHMACTRCARSRAHSADGRTWPVNINPNASGNPVTATAKAIKTPQRSVVSDDSPRGRGRRQRGGEGGREREEARSAGGDDRDRGRETGQRD